MRSEFDINEYDIWTENGRSEVEQIGFRNGLIKYYRVGVLRSFFSNGVQCMVTGEWHSRKHNNVIAAHIWMSKTRGKGLPKFGLSDDDLMTPRNGFLALKDIEDKFDRKQLCFLYNPLSTQGKFTVKLLDPAIRPLVIRQSRQGKTFAQIDVIVLQHPQLHFPYRRLLGFHARCSYALARIKGWIAEGAVFAEYFDISETASAPETYR